MCRANSKPTPTLEMSLLCIDRIRLALKWNSRGVIGVRTATEMSLEDLFLVDQLVETEQPNN